MIQLLFKLNMNCKDITISWETIVKELKMYAQFKRNVCFESGARDSSEKPAAL